VQKEKTRQASPIEPGIAVALLAWYDRERRLLPWRAAPGETSDPYQVWLSEIMLQQTTVKAVLPRYAAFLRRWPDIKALARAELGQVLAAWAGLGYYARARRLHDCATVVGRELGGRFPDTEAALQELPGIGPYTAAAIAAIAFDVPAVVVDGNVERVMARLFAETEPLPAAKPRLRARAADPQVPAAVDGEARIAAQQAGRHVGGEALAGAAGVEPHAGRALHGARLVEVLADSVRDEPVGG